MASENSCESYCGNDLRFTDFAGAYMFIMPNEILWRATRVPFYFAVCGEILFSDNTSRLVYGKHVCSLLLFLFRKMED
jgi:hypothetical protein